MVAAKKSQEVPADVKVLVADQVKKALEQKASSDLEPTKGLDFRDQNAGWKKDALPPRPDQEYLDQADPKHKGAGIDVVRWAYAQHLAKSNGRSMEEMATFLGDTRMKAAVKKIDSYRESVLKTEKAAYARTKALAESSLIDGGALTPPEYSSEFLPLLRNVTTILQAGARVMGMSGQTLVLGRQNAAGTATYVGENAAIPASQQQFGQLAFATKKLAALTGFSNDLLRDGGPDAELKVRDDLVQVVGIKFDLTATRGDGTQGTIKGLRNLTNSANIFAATQAGASATFQEIANDLAKAKRLIKAANVPLNGLCWIISPRSEQYLTAVSSTFGVFPFKDEMMQKGTLWGIPFLVTAQIPENLGGGTNESEVYLCAFPQYLVGQNTALEVAFFPNGAAVDTGGTAVISGISNDLSWLRALARHDTQLAYDKACVVITTVKWF